MILRSFLFFLLIVAGGSVSEAQFGGGGARIGGPVDRWNSNPTNRQLATSAPRFTAENVRHPVETDWETIIQKQKEKLEEEKRQEGQLPKPEVPALDVPQNYAVLIGVNQYKRTASNRNDLQQRFSLSSLKCCVNDTKILAEKLEKGKFALKENIYVMNDKVNDPTMLPTKENILNCIGRVIQLARESNREGSIVLVAFSGHGCSMPDQDGVLRGYLCPADTDVSKGKDEIWNLDTLIGVSYLFAGLENEREVKKIAILDACRNSPLGNEKADGKGGSRLIQIKDAKGVVVESLAAEYVLTSDVSKADLERYRNLFRITSCTQGQSSYEDVAIGHGIFTKCLLEGLDGKADMNRDGKVTIAELTEYVIETTPLYAHDLSKRLKLKKSLMQNPLHSSNEFGTCVITINTQKP